MGSSGTASSQSSAWNALLWWPTAISLQWFSSGQFDFEQRQCLLPWPLTYYICSANQGIWNWALSVFVVLACLSIHCCSLQRQSHVFHNMAISTHFPFRSMPPPSRMDYQTNMSSPTYTIAPPASIVTGIMSTNIPQAQTSLTTNMAAPPITNFQGVPPAVKGSTARKRKASAQHSLPQHRAGRSQLNPFNSFQPRRSTFVLSSSPMWYASLSFGLSNTLTV